VPAAITTAKQNGDTLKALTSYSQALEFAHFGSELALNTKKDVILGEKLHALMTQIPGETYSLLAQQMMLDMVLDPQIGAQIDIATLKKAAISAAAESKSDTDYDQIMVMLREQVTPEVTT
jgi:F0F1-type ATP synthase alpha subunit